MKTINRRAVLEYPPYLTVELHQVELPNGQTIKDWTWLVTPDYASIVVQIRDGRFLCFRQRKYGLDGFSLAPAGGYLEPGEDPLDGARRELREETGYVAAEWIDLGTFVVDSNRGAGRAHFYLALDASPAGAPTAPDVEESETLLLTREEVERALDAGEFKALAWSAVFALALRKLRISGT